jgi:Domain of unknown function (DUF5666)
MGTKIISLRGGAFAVTVLVAAVLSACGGGGSATATAGNTSFAMGRIAGFGSIIVNGVHYDERGASVEDEDGDRVSSDDLKLGSMVEVDGGEVDQSGAHPTAMAEQIKLVSLAKGPVESIGASSFTVLGQSVQVTATTVFDDSLSGGLGALRAGAVVKVYGVLDVATGTYTASRVEPKSSASSYSLRGIVSALDATARTLSIGTAVFDVSATTLPAGLAVGSSVRVRTQTAQVAGLWVAQNVRAAETRRHDSDHAEVEGTISSFTSSAVFSVDGMPVDATNASFPDGNSGLIQGARVEVEGAVVNGTLVATKVELKSNEEDSASGFEIEGSISAADATASIITVRGVSVKYGTSTTIRNGSLADLVIGVRVEVHSTLAADGVTLEATSIEIKRNS